MEFRNNLHEKFQVTEDREALPGTPEQPEALYELFHENSKIKAYMLGDLAPPSVDFREATRRILLDPLEEAELPNESILGLITRRRSQRDFGRGKLAFKDLSTILQYSVGRRENDPGFRAVPSAGALYPCSLYCLVSEVQGLESGVYSYDIEANTLVARNLGDVRDALHWACVNDENALKSSSVLLVSAEFGQTVQKYGERGYRHVLMEAGHIIQNVYLLSTALGVACYSIGGFLDDDINQLVGVDGLDEAVLYLACLGRPK